MNDDLNDILNGSQNNGSDDLPQDFSAQNPANFGSFYPNQPADEPEAPAAENYPYTDPAYYSEAEPDAAEEPAVSAEADLAEEPALNAEADAADEPVPNAEAEPVATPETAPQDVSEEHTAENVGAPQYRNPYAAPQQPVNGTADHPAGEDPQRNKNPYSNSGTYPYGPAVAPGQGGVDRRNPYAYSNNPQEGKKKNGGKVVIILLCVILALVLALLVHAVVKGERGRITEPTNTHQAGDPVENVEEATTALSPSSSDKTISADDTIPPTEIYKKILPSSVGLLVYANSSRSLSSEGSGVIWTEDTTGEYTYIITCAHVIAGAGQSIVVQLYDEKEYPAQIVGYDKRTDIGVVRIEATGLNKIEIGDSKSLQVGDIVYAIGNPGGTEFANTFTNGIITALDRPVASSSSGYTMECIQHNAAINPGNSGGALVNEYGQLIGINSMKIVDDEYEGMGFSVPSSVFVEVINDIIAHGYVANRPKIGISYLRASAEQAYAMFVAIKGLPSGSIIIAEVSEDSDFYGKLKKGDLVTAINGSDLNSSTDLAAMIEDMNVGDPITMKVVRIHNDYTFDEVTVSGVLVEDKTDYTQQEETTTSSGFEDYFGDYFDDPFDNDFGFNLP